RNVRKDSRRFGSNPTQVRFGMQLHTPIAVGGPSWTPCTERTADGDRLARSHHMKERSLTLPEIGLIAGTRVALGVGIGLLISDRLNKDQRKAAGWALFGMGLVTTFPIVAGILGKGPFAVRPVGLAAYSSPVQKAQ